MIRKQISKEAAIRHLETLCARGEECRYDLDEKLRRRGFSASDREEILDNLERKRFFSDARFAAAFAHDKMLFNRWGKMKITMALRAKRISPAIIRDALDLLSEEEYEQVLEDFLRAKARTIAGLDTYEGRTKLYRAAIARGFESSLVSRLIKTLTYEV